MDDQKQVRFGGKIISLCGLLAGLAIALGLPYIVLVYGTALTVGVQTTIIIIAALVGGLISLTATFFGLVIPSKVGP